MAENEKPTPAPKIRPGDLEEHGVTIPVPTPSGIVIPNPFTPNGNGNRQSVPPAEAPKTK